MDEQPTGGRPDDADPLLLVQVDRLPTGEDDEGPVHPVLLDTEEGLVALAFTSPERLVAVLGAEVPWAVLTPAGVLAVAGAAGASRLVVDAEPLP